MKDGVFELTPETTIAYEDAVAESVAEYLASVLKPGTGLSLKTTSGSTSGDNFIARLKPHLAHLDAAEVNYRKLD